MRVVFFSFRFQFRKQHKEKTIPTSAGKQYPLRKQKLRLSGSLFTMQSSKGRGFCFCRTLQSKYHANTAENAHTYFRREKRFREAESFKYLFFLQMGKRKVSLWYVFSVSAYASPRGFFTDRAETFSTSLLKHVTKGIDMSGKRSFRLERIKQTISEMVAALPNSKED